MGQRGELQNEEGNKVVRHLEKTEKLKWFLRNVQVIAPWDRFVLEYTEESIEYMSTYTKTRLVRNLETLQKVYAEERLTVDKGQSVIRKFFMKKKIEE